MKKKKKILVGVSGSLGVLIVGVAITLVCGYFSGWDIIGWLTSPTAIMLYVLILLLIVFGIGVLVKLHYKDK